MYICAIFHIAIGVSVCYNTIVPKGSQEATGADGRVDYTIKWSKKVLKKIKIPLDKFSNLWYNTNVKRTGTSYRIN